MRQGATDDTTTNHKQERQRCSDVGRGSCDGDSGGNSEGVVAVALAASVAVATAMAATTTTVTAVARDRMTAMAAANAMATTEVTAVTVVMSTADAMAAMRWLSSAMVVMRQAVDDGGGNGVFAVAINNDNAMMAVAMTY